MAQRQMSEFQHKTAQSIGKLLDQRHMRLHEAVEEALRMILSYFGSASAVSKVGTQEIPGNVAIALQWLPSDRRYQNHLYTIAAIDYLSEIVIGKTFLIGEGLAGYAIQQEEDLLKNDIHENETLHNLCFRSGDNISQSAIVTLIRIGSRIVGAILLVCREKNCFRDGDQVFVQQMVSHLLILIQEKQRWYRETQIDVITTLNNSIRRYKNLTDFSRIVRQAFSECARVYAAIHDNLHGYLYLLQNDQLVVFETYNVQELTSDTLPIGIDVENIPGRVIALGTSIIETNRVHQGWKLPIEGGYESWVAVPVADENRHAIGVLYLLSHRSGTFHHDDLPFIEEVATQLAIAKGYLELQETQRRSIMAVGSLGNMEHLIHVVTHQAGQPLMIIRGLSDEALEDLKSSNEHIDPDLYATLFEALEEILKQHRILDQEIARYKEIFGIQKNESYSENDHVTSYNLELNLKQAEKDASPMLRKLGADLQIEIECPSSINVKADFTLTSVFRELIVNSGKYLGRERGNLKITVQVYLEYIEIGFVDNGSGIDPHYLSKILQGGYRTEEARKMREGTGLGLYGAWLKVVALGGNLKVYSEGIGKGSAFFITLPRLTTTGSLIKGA